MRRALPATQGAGSAGVCASTSGCWPPVDVGWLVILPQRLQGNHLLLQSFWGAGILLCVCLEQLLPVEVRAGGCREKGSRGPEQRLGSRDGCGMSEMLSQRGGFQLDKSRSSHGGEDAPLQPWGWRKCFCHCNSL